MSKKISSNDQKVDKKKFGKNHDAINWNSKKNATKSK